MLRLTSLIVYLAGLLCATAARPYAKGSGRRCTATEHHGRQCGYLSFSTRR